MAIIFFIALTLTFSLSSSFSDFTVVTSDDSLVDSPQPTVPAGAFTDRTEQRAVRAIMSATGNSWAASIPDVCQGRWHGIECMPDHDNVFHVISLSFGALSLDTAFPICDQNSSFLHPSLSKLRHLKSLFLYQCSSLNPTLIPSFLSLLGPSLKSLVLRENGHVGPIPGELSRLTNLRVLDLQGNFLSSFVPGSVTGIQGLRLVDLSGNKLTGSVPNFSSPELRVLDLNGNFFNGQIPPAIGACSELVKLDLSKNRISGGIPSSFSGLRELILLDLSRNQISGSLPESLSSLKSLKTLILSDNNMGGEALRGEVFEGLTALTALVLSNVGFQGFIPESIGKLTSLRVLHLDGNSFNGSVPESFRDLADLSELRVNDNQLTGSLPINRRVLWRMGRKLKVENNKGLCYRPDNEVEVPPPYLAGVPLCGRDSVATVAAALAMPSPAPVGNHP